MDVSSIEGVLCDLLRTLSELSTIKYQYVLLNITYGLQNKNVTRLKCNHTNIYFDLFMVIFVCTYFRHCIYCNENVLLSAETTTFPNGKAFY